MSIALEFCPATQVPATALHEAFGAAFADYLIGPFMLPFEAWPAFLARQGVDLGLSRVALDGQGRILAFALSAPRPRHASWRLGTMGALPAARGSGAAPALLEDFLARARQAGCRRAELEVFAQNERARRLYERQGFVARDPLHGYTGAVPAGPLLVARELAWKEALDWLDEAEGQDLALPLQQTRPGLDGAMGQRAWAWGSALLTGAPRADDAEVFQIGALVDRSPAQLDAQALLQSLAAQHPQWQEWRMAQLLRPGVGGEALERLGLQRQPLYQLWMLRAL
ncbi:GNAT family N-acetyltransferase [Mitsuaria sp. WAJ17]|uniref:GNAT family N-acetyltransferase n=1 Tax=Mitsuaria sp. WAJ17 TaxID=2761452 RepID=UPI001602BE93|nr:GNAT family N-acetyltransferase [Mitsuaria sp. WAJ17]MBB2484674.1 GNAT family N-acetyltransferase [Mitsuaria sp. WAJ17]